MIRRTFDVAEVVRWIKRDFPDADEKALTVGYDDALGNEMNVCLCEGEGGAIFLWRGPGIYEVHCFFEQRGREVRDISRRILKRMAREHGARLVWAAIPEASRKVKIYVGWLGFKPAGQATFPHGPCDLFTWENDPCHP